VDLLKETKDWCEKYDIIPARSKGQNFLIDESVYHKIVTTADLRPDDIVLEVGPGFGFLTEQLAKRVKQVIAVELDDKLAEILKERLTAEKIENVEIVNEDILEVRSEKLEVRSNEYKIVANLPYNISSRFLRQFLGSDQLRPKMMVLMLQKEVAARVAAKPGEMSLLAVSVQFFCQPEIISLVPKTAFWPAPEGDSAIMKLEVRSKESEAKSVKLEGGNEKDFFRLVKIGFSARRKKLLNNLAAGYRIGKPEALAAVLAAGLSENVRPQDLSVADWIKLFKISEFKF